MSNAGIQSLHIERINKSPEYVVVLKIGGIELRSEVYDNADLADRNIAWIRESLMHELKNT